MPEKKKKSCFTKPNQERSQTEQSIGKERRKKKKKERRLGCVKLLWFCFGFQFSRLEMRAGES